jgi:hypothetical protein
LPRDRATAAPVGNEDMTAIPITGAVGSPTNPLAIK